nr:reverse transcriptase domain-containing protein [Tanacetum cinerariifolium]
MAWARGKSQGLWMYECSHVMTRQCVVMIPFLLAPRVSALARCDRLEFDGKGSAVALTRWIKKMESMFDNSGCTVNQRMRAFLVEEFCPSNEIEKLENEFWNHTMVGANHVAYTDRFHELAKLVPHLVTPESSRIKRYINGLAPQIRGMLRATQPTTIQSAILTAGILTDEVVRCGTLTMGNNKRKEMEESSKQGSTWKENKKSKTRSWFVATVPPRNDNVSTYPQCAKCYTFHPKNAPCKLCITAKNQNKAVIVCHEKVVEIPIKKGGILRVQGERTLGAAKALMNAKINEPRISNIPVMRDFTDVFLEDLLGLPLQRKVEFRIDLVPGETPVAKSPYRLAPSEMQELSGQL